MKVREAACKVQDALQQSVAAVVRGVRITCAGARPPDMQAGSIGGLVARRRLLGYPSPLDSDFWYRPKHAAPSLLIRIARRLSFALALAEFSGYQRPANVV